MVRLKTTGYKLGKDYFAEFVFDGRTGDQTLIASYFSQNGFWSVAAPLGDKRLYFLVDAEGVINGNTGDEKSGIKISCMASWLSGVPFLFINVMNKTGAVAMVKAN